MGNFYRLCIICGMSGCLKFYRYTSTSSISFSLPSAFSTARKATTLLSSLGCSKRIFTPLLSFTATALSRVVVERFLRYVYCCVGMTLAFCLSFIVLIRLPCSHSLLSSVPFPLLSESYQFSYFWSSYRGPCP